MKKLISTVTICFLLQIGFSQVGINVITPDPSAALEIFSTDKGLLIPRVASTDDVASPATGLMVYNSTDNSFYFYNGSSWQQIVADRSFLSDLDKDTKVLVESLPDEDVIRMELEGTEKFVFQSDTIGRSRIYYANNRDNIAIGELSLDNNTTGERNFANGHYSLKANTTGRDNIGNGFFALESNKIGSNNIAIGNFSLRSNTTGGANIGIGVGALRDNNAAENVAIGTNSMANTTTGGRNVSVGTGSMLSNKTGNSNVVSGFAAMFLNTAGSGNIASGDSALRENAEGNRNVAIGSSAMRFNNTGNNNVAIGTDALKNNKIGSGNVAIGNGAGALDSVSNKLYINNSSGSINDVLIYGDFADDFVVVDDRLSVGMPISDFNSEMILALQGNSATDTLIACEDHNSNDRFEVYANGNAWLSGVLTEASDRRLKKNIHPLTSSLSSLLALNGYNYDWKDPNSSKELQTGVIAQEVIEVFPELVSTDKEFYSVNYIGLIPHLIEGIKEQQEIIELQKNELEQMKSEMQSMKVMLKELAAKIEQ